MTTASNTTEFNPFTAKPEELFFYCLDKFTNERTTDAALSLRIAGSMYSEKSNAGTLTEADKWIFSDALELCQRNDAAVMARVKAEGH